MRIAVLGSSGAGKTTLSRHLAELHGVPHVELDQLHHLQDWEPAPDFELQVESRLEEAGWVLDGNYMGRLGDRVLRRADLIVWLDLPLSICLARLLPRTVRRLVRREVLWNGNRESFAEAFLTRDSLIRYTIRHHGRRRQEWPPRLAGMPVVRLRSPAAVRAWLTEMERAHSRAMESRG